MHFPKLPNWRDILLVILTIATLVSLVIAVKSPGGRSYPREAPSPVYVDYEKISSYIDKKVTSLPAPKDGVSGSNGARGERGAEGEPGATGPQGEAGATGATGEQGIQGEQGVPGSPGKTPETRCVDLLVGSRIDIRYVGDITWKVWLLVPDGKCP